MNGEGEGVKEKHRRQPVAPPQCLDAQRVAVEEQRPLEAVPEDEFEFQDCL